MTSSGKQLLPRVHLVFSGRPVFVDIEGSDLELVPKLYKKGIGRISIVNEEGQVILDTFVYYPDWAGQKPGWFKSGVSRQDLDPTVGANTNDCNIYQRLTELQNFAQPIGEVLQGVKSIFDKSGVVVGHAIRNEQEWLRGLPWKDWQLRDTQAYSGFAKYASHFPDNRIPSLKNLAFDILGAVIQKGSHDSIVDAQTTKDIFLRFEKEINAEQSTPKVQGRLLYEPPGNLDFAADPTASSLECHVEDASLATVDHTVEDTAIKKLSESAALQELKTAFSSNLPTSTKKVSSATSSTISSRNDSPRMSMTSTTTSISLAGDASSFKEVATVAAATAQACRKGSKPKAQTSNLIADQRLEAIGRAGAIATPLAPRRVKGSGEQNRKLS